MAATSAGHEELARLAQAVGGWFRQATKRFALPSADGCRMIATYLIVLGAKENDYEKPARQTKAAKSGKAFLRHLAAESRRIEEWISLVSRGRPALPRLQEKQEIQVQINETRRHIESLLPFLSARPDPFRDPIRLLAARAQEAWEETNDGRAPRSKNPDDPLCRFVATASPKSANGGARQRSAKFCGAGGAHKKAGKIRNWICPPVARWLGAYMGVRRLDCGGQKCRHPPSGSVERASFGPRAPDALAEALALLAALGWTQALFRIKEAERILGISRAGIYRDLSAGRLDAVKIGTATRITAQSLARRIVELPKAGRTA